MSASFKDREDGARIYQRGANGYWFADFRHKTWQPYLLPTEQAQHFPLCVPGTNTPTTKEDEALLLYTRKCAELLERKNGRVNDEPAGITFGEWIPQFIALRRETFEGVRRSAATEIELRHLNDVVFHRVLQRFGAGRRMETVRPKEVTAWLLQLAKDAGATAKEPGDATRKLSRSSVNKHRWALNALYAEAIAQDMLPAGSNPIAALPKRRQRSDEAKVDPLEPPEVVLMLEALRLGLPKHNRVLPFFREYIATLLYTGLRPSEAKELLVKHVRFNDQTILAWRHDDRSSDLKTEGSERAVPMYPQLAAILEPYCEARRQEVGDDGFLFAHWSPGKQREVTIGDIRKAWWRLLDFCEIRRRRVYDLRHTFASCAVQLLRGGAPITELDVAWLLGHTNALLVRKRYAHRLKYIPPRSEVLEFSGAHWTHLTDYFHDRLMRLYQRAGVTPVEQPATPTAKVNR